MVGVPSFEHTKDLISKFKLATENNDLDENQQLLLQKIISLDAFHIDGENDIIKRRLYELFFDWTSKEHKSDKNQQSHKHQENKHRDKKKHQDESEIEKIKQLQLD